MCAVKIMAATYEDNRSVLPLRSFYFPGTRSHTVWPRLFQLLPQDYVSPYYRDESLLLGLGFTPYELMLQLLAKRDDIFYRWAYLL